MDILLLACPPPSVISRKTFRWVAILRYFWNRGPKICQNRDNSKSTWPFSYKKKRVGEKTSRIPKKKLTIIPTVDFATKRPESLKIFKIGVFSVFQCVSNTEKRLFWNFQQFSGRLVEKSTVGIFVKFLFGITEDKI